MKVFITLLLLGCFAGAQEGPAPASLRSVRKVFIEKMDSDLDQYLRVEIMKQMNGRLKVVLTKEDADAVLTGVSENNKGWGHQVTGRYLGLHDTATASISLVDKEGKHILWASEAGDRNLFFGAAKRGGPRKVADRIIHNLRNAMGS